MIIVETTQPSQIAMQGIVNIEEMEFQRVSRQYHVVAGQVRGIIKRYIAAEERLIVAWIAENYPGLRYWTKPLIRGGDTLEFGVEVTIESRISAALTAKIQRELSAYLVRLEN